MRLPVFVAFAAVACSAPPRTANHADPLALDAPTIAKLDPRCASRISRSPFAYFRFTNRPFVDVVCDRYAGAIASMPLVHSHGDAHIEQYAVAAEGRGLADYDASAIGPPVVDLTRFATSVVLAWPDDPAAAKVAIEAFLRGYTRALEDPTTSFREPAAAARLRARFAPTRLEWLDRAEKLIVPIRADADMHDAKDAWLELMTQIRSTNPDLAPSFFAVKVGGQLDLGIGSYHAHKFLVRIEGPTPAPDDDLMVEAKALEQHTLGACMRGADLDANRVVRGQSQISNAPQRFLGAVTIRGKPFYSHTWLTHYTELSTSDVGSAEELAEIAEDVGVQLGKGHGKTVDRGQEAPRRRALQRTIATMRPRLEETAFDLAVHVRRTWNEFVTRDPGERTAAR